MLAIERRNAILSKLSTEGKVIVADLSREFDVTEETIRRDLEKLDNEGLAKKTYGGAVLSQSLHIDLPFKVRKHFNVELKQKVAEKVADLVNDGDYIMMDASSTAIYATQYIKNLKKKGVSSEFLNSLGLEAKFVQRYLDGEFASYEEFL